MGTPRRGDRGEAARGTLPASPARGGPARSEEGRGPGPGAGGSHPTNESASTACSTRCEGQARLPKRIGEALTPSPTATHTRGDAAQGTCSLSDAAAAPGPAVGRRSRSPRDRTRELPRCGVCGDREPARRPVRGAGPGETRRPGEGRAAAPSRREGRQGVQGTGRPEGPSLTSWGAAGAAVGEGWGAPSGVGAGKWGRGQKPWAHGRKQQ